MMRNSNERPSEKWLDAYQDPAAMLYTFSSGLCLADLHGDGEYRLVAADLGTGTYNMRLKVYKGIHLVSEHTIVDLPTGLVAFHMETSDPRAAAIAAASGGNIYVYKNMRPFYKFTLPGLDIHPEEAVLWDKAREGQLSASDLQDALEILRAEVKESCLTARSQRFLRLEPEELEGFVRFHQHFPLRRQTVITCLTTMKKSLAEETALSCLVLGTESRQVYVLEPNAFTILSVMALASVPVFLDVSGLFDVEYSIVAACRDAALYTLKRGYKAGKQCVQLSSQVSGVARLGANVAVSTMAPSLACYSLKGKCLWTLPLGSPVTAMASVSLEHLSVAAVVVATEDGALRLYQDRSLCDAIAAPGRDPVVGIRFGRFGREENTLILVTKGGGLQVKILKRTAQFDSKELKEAGEGLDNSTQKLNIPKKTKLFVDQTMRERDNALDMHRIFQGDLFRLKLHIYREVFGVVSSARQPVSECLPVRIAAQVVGLGPLFRLQVALHNSSAQAALAGLFLLMDFDSTSFSLCPHHVDLPMILPNQNFEFAVRVEALAPQMADNIIKVYVIREDVPLVTAVVTMPMVEGEKPPGMDRPQHNFEELPLSGELKKHAERMTAHLLDQHAL